MLRGICELWSRLCLERRMCQNPETLNLIRRPMLIVVLTKVVTAWVHIGDITDLLQDDA